MSLFSDRLEGKEVVEKSTEEEILFPIAELRSVDEIMDEACLEDDEALEIALKEIRSNRSQRVYEARETRKAKGRKQRAKAKAKAKSKSKSKSTSKKVTKEKLTVEEAQQKLLEKLFGEKP